MCEQTDTIATIATVATIATTDRSSKESSPSEQAGYSVNPETKVKCSDPVKSTPSLKVYKKPSSSISPKEEPSWAKPLSYFELKRRMKEVKDKEKYYPKPRPLGKVRVL